MQGTASGDREQQNYPRSLRRSLPAVIKPAQSEALPAFRSPVCSSSSPLGSTTAFQVLGCWTGQRSSSVPSGASQGCHLPSTAPVPARTSAAPPCPVGTERAHPGTRMPLPPAPPPKHCRDIPRSACVGSCSALIWVDGNKQCYKIGFKGARSVGALPPGSCRTHEHKIALIEPSQLQQIKALICVTSPIYTIYISLLFLSLHFTSALE